MSTRNPVADVPFILRSSLPHLPTAADPSADLAVQAYDLGSGGGFISDPKLLVTVLSMLDEPVEAVACHAVDGTIGWVPVVRSNLDDVPDRSPTHEKAGDGLPGIGWIDPAGYPDMVAVGTWTVDSSGVGSTSWSFIKKAAAVLHLRCTNSKVDILVGGLTAERFAGGGGPNPYNIELHEPGTFHPSDDSYQEFYDNHVDDNGTQADQEGHSTVAPVYYLARTPQGHKDYHWHILLFLGPRPIKTMWDEPPPLSSDIDQERARLKKEDAVQRLVASYYSGKPDAEQAAVQKAVLAEFSTFDAFMVGMTAYGRLYGIADPDAATTGIDDPAGVAQK